VTARHAAILGAACASGCAISGGTANVGIWRPQRVVDTTVCIEESPGVCAKTVDVGRDVPARRFAGGMFAWFNPGYMHVRGSDAPHRFALSSHYDYLRGRGAFAIGGRVGADVAFGAERLMFTFPTSVVGYWGLPRISFYAGAGYTYATGEPMQASPHGIHVLAGSRIVMRKNRSSRVSLSLETYRTYFRELTATSVTSNIGVHF
jgi:hypothetical protein